MLLDHRGRPIAVTAEISASFMHDWNRRVLEAQQQSVEFIDELQGRIVDDRGRPVFSKTYKIGDTITAQKPYRFRNANAGLGNA